MSDSVSKTVSMDIHRGSSPSHHEEPLRLVPFNTVYLDIAAATAESLFALDTAGRHKMFSPSIVSRPSGVMRAFGRIQNSNQRRTFFDSSPKTKAKVVLVGSGRMGNVRIQRSLLEEFYNTHSCRLDLLMFRFVATSSNRILALIFEE